jgi:hypothetical protein
MCKIDALLDKSIRTACVGYYHGDVGIKCDSFHKCDEDLKDCICLGSKYKSINK